MHILDFDTLTTHDLIPVFGMRAVRWNYVLFTSRLDKFWL